MTIIMLPIPQYILPLQVSLPFLWAWSLREINPSVSPTIDGVLEPFDMVVKLLNTDWSSAKNESTQKIISKRNK